MLHCTCVEPASIDLITFILSSRAEKRGIAKKRVGMDTG